MKITRNIIFYISCGTIKTNHPLWIMNDIDQIIQLINIYFLNLLNHYTIMIMNNSKKKTITYYLTLLSFISFLYLIHITADFVTRKYRKKYI